MSYPLENEKGYCVCVCVCKCFFMFHCVSVKLVICDSIPDKGDVMFAASSLINGSTIYLVTTLPKNEESNDATLHPEGMLHLTRTPDIFNVHPKS